jgi:hypothetical protein
LPVSFNKYWYTKNILLWPTPVFFSGNSQLKATITHKKYFNAITFTLLVREKLVRWFMNS